MSKKGEIRSIIIGLIVFAVLAMQVSAAEDWHGPFASIGIPKMSGENLMGVPTFSVDSSDANLPEKIVIFRFFNPNAIEFDQMPWKGVAMKVRGRILFTDWSKEKVYRVVEINFTVGPSSEYINLIPIPAKIKNSRSKDAGFVIVEAEYSVYRISFGENLFNGTIDPNPVEVPIDIRNEKKTISAFPIRLSYPFVNVPEPAEDKVPNKTASSFGAMGAVSAVIIAAIIVRKTKRKI